MRKKIITIAGLAGAVALTGLAGAAYAADDGPTQVTAKPANAVVVTCGGKMKTGRPGDPRTFGFQTGPEIKGPDGKVTFAPKPGLQVQKFADGKGTAVQPRDGKVTLKVAANGVMVGKPGKGVKCVFVPKGAAPLPAK